MIDRDSAALISQFNQPAKYVERNLCTQLFQITQTQKKTEHALSMPGHFVFALTIARR